MGQVDLHLSGAILLDDGIYGQPRVLGVAVNRIDDRAVFIDRRHGIGLVAAAPASGAAHRRFDRFIGVQVGPCQVKLQLGRDHRFPALLRIAIHDVLEHVARRNADRAAVAIEQVVNNLQRGLLGPGYRLGGGHVGLQYHVALRPLVDDVHFDVPAGYRLVKDGNGQVGFMIRVELAQGHSLAA